MSPPLEGTCASPGKHGGVLYDTVDKSCLLVFGSLAA